jgi:hypothetical protein
MMECARNALGRLAQQINRCVSEVPHSQRPLGVPTLAKPLPISRSHLSERRGIVAAQGQIPNKEECNGHTNGHTVIDRGDGRLSAAHRIHNVIAFYDAALTKPRCF